jgi:glutathione synthase/RimK-type ligase-like ATP-grasp enzyme
LTSPDFPRTIEFHGGGRTVALRDGSPPQTGVSISTPSAVSMFAFSEDRPHLASLHPADTAALRAEGDLSLMALLEDLQCPVVNRIAGGLSNNSKPYQALVISGVGLSVPPTLVTSAPTAVRAFQAEHAR